MAGGEYSKLSQADEETGCQFVRQEKHRHENDARRRLCHRVSVLRSIYYLRGYR